MEALGGNKNKNCVRRTGSSVVRPHLQWDFLMQARFPCYCWRERTANPIKVCGMVAMKLPT